MPNGKIIRLLVDDEPFDVRYGRLLAHQRTLDFRAGTLRREVEWETPAGRRVRVRSTRLVSLSQRAVLAIRYEVEPVDTSVRVVVQSELLATSPCPNPMAMPGPTTPSPPRCSRGSDHRGDPRLPDVPHPAQRAAAGRGRRPRATGRPGNRPGDDGRRTWRG